MTTPNSFSGSAVSTTLQGYLSPSDTSFTISNGSGWVETVGANIGQPLGTSGPFVVCVDYGTANEERILCSGISPTKVVTVWTSGGATGRGYDGTTPQGHSSAVVAHTISTDVPYQANLGVTNAAAASAAAAAAQTTANSALAAAAKNAWASNKGISTGLALTNNYPTGYYDSTRCASVGITGYTNYLVTVTFYLIAGTAPANPYIGFTSGGTSMVSAQSAQVWNVSTTDGTVSASWMFSPGDTGAHTLFAVVARNTGSSISHTLYGSTITAIGVN